MRAPWWQMVVVLAVAAAGAALLAAGWHLHASAARLLSEGERALGEVVQVLNEQRETRDPDHGAGQGQPNAVVVRGRTPLYVYSVEVPVVRFTASDGRVVEVRGADTVPGTITPGGALLVYYPPNEPQLAWLESELADPTGPLCAGGARSSLPASRPVHGLATVARPGLSPAKKDEL